MSEIHQDIIKLEEEIEKAEVAVQQRDGLVRLAQNPDFRKYIVEGFMKDECARMTHMSTDPNLSLQDRADCLGSAQAAGHLKRWINALNKMGDNAERNIIQCKETLDELRGMSRED